MRGHARQSGFALLMTLLLLTIAAVALADLGRRSAADAMRANHAHDALQRRWAVRTAEAVLLPQTAQLFAHEDERRAETGMAVGDPPVALHRTFILSDKTFDMVFADEQAKVNLNTLERRRGQNAVEWTVQRMAAITAVHLPVMIRRDPVYDDSERQDDRPRYATFDQLFDAVSPQMLIHLDQDQHHPSFAHRVTLWGDGRVHARRAPQEVLEAALAPEIGPAQIQRLLAARQERPDIGLDRVLDLLELSFHQRQRMRGRITVETRCVSLWVVQQGHHRQWHHLAVLEQPRTGSPQMHRLYW